jgi:hypothetical protein
LAVAVFLLSATAFADFLLAASANLAAAFASASAVLAAFLASASANLAAALAAAASFAATFADGGLAHTCARAHGARDATATRKAKQWSEKSGDRVWWQGYGWWWEVWRGTLGNSATGQWPWVNHHNHTTIHVCKWRCECLTACWADNNMRSLAIEENIVAGAWGMDVDNDGGNNNNNNYNNNSNNSNNNNNNNNNNNGCFA